MAVKSKNNWCRSSMIALAIGALSLPALAQAEPDQKRSWADRVAREDSPRAARPERPARQAAPQAQAQAPAPQRQQQTPRSWSPPPQPQGGVHAAPQSRWNGGEGRRSGDNGQRRGRTNGTEDQRSVRQAQQAPQTRQAPAGTSWRDRAARIDERERRERNRDWRGRDWQGERAANAPAATTQTRTGSDWRSRVQRTDARRSADRDYWRNRDWRNHWDHSRHGNWSGWNNQWNWTWGHDYRRWNTRWRGSSRYDWYGWRNRYPSYFQVGFYSTPYRGYSYRRLSIGAFLDELFFGDDYWIANPSYYRLPEAYGPYRWVRYYDDAVLVNIYSGEVADVIHDFFW